VQDLPKPFWEHLGELRSRLIRSIAVFAGFIALFLILPSFHDSFALRLMRHLPISLIPDPYHLIFLDALEPLWVAMKVAFTLALFFSSPYLLFEGISFLAPAFSAAHRKLLIGSVGAGFLLFAGGVYFSYRVMVPVTLDVLLQYGVAAGGQPALTVSSFFGFLLIMLLLFGIPFELPLVMGLLVRSQVVPLDVMMNARRFVYVGIVVVAAVLTPDPTPFSQMILSVVMILLYELGILIGRWL